MASTTKHSYKANCHCGQVKLTFTIPEPLEESEVCRCNCSICTKSGYMLVYPMREDVTFIAGEKTLSQYRFGKKNKPHKFCPNCGTSMFIDFKDAVEEKQRQYIALNIHTIVDIQDLMPKLKFRDFDGHKLLSPPYQVPE